MSIALNLTAIGLIFFAAFLHLSKRGGIAPFVFLVVVCLFFGNLGFIKSFRASPTGFQAETREIVDEAKGVIKELRSIAKELGRELVDLVNMAGRGGGYSDERKAETTQRILASLRRIGLSDAEIEEVRLAEREYVLFDYGRTIELYAGRNLTKEILAVEGVKERADEFSKSHVGGIGDQPSPDEIEEFYNSVDAMTPDLQGLIDDYRYYEQHSRHRRPELWKSRWEWYKEPRIDY